MNVNILNRETEDELLERLDRMGHISYSEYGFMSREKGVRERFFRNIIRNKHLSVVEHIVFYIEIEGVSRFTLNQLVRHRIASYTQQSQRYTKTKLEYYIPSSIKENDCIMSEYKEAVEKIYETYTKFIKEYKIPKEDARCLLPISMLSNISMTINLRSLINFFELRTDNHAQKEIRDLAKLIAKKLKEKYPITINELEDSGIIK